MPKRTDIKSILIIGAGPIVIGQACEFDYSGVQACKALRAEGYRIILVNSNPATIMTDPERGRRHLHRADHARDGREDHREGAARRPAAHHGRPDGAEHRPGAGSLGRPGEVRRRDDRRQGRRHRQGRGPPEIPRRHGQAGSGKPQAPRPPTHMDEAAGRPGVRRPAGHRPPVASPWPAPAAASPTTSRSSARSWSAAWTCRPPPRC